MAQSKDGSVNDQKRTRIEVRDYDPATMPPIATYNAMAGGRDEYHYILLPDGRSERICEPSESGAVRIARFPESEPGCQDGEIMKLVELYAIQPDGDPTPAPQTESKLDRSAAVCFRGDTGNYEDPGPFDASPEQLAALRPHVVNLRRGQLSDDGLMQTSERDLVLLADRIKVECVEGNKTLLFYAHGGLTSEKYGLASAWAYHRWWLAHDVYPVYFIWETGALETLWQIIHAKLPRTRSVTRDLYDFTSDPLIERIAKGPGTLLWSGMKDSARLASERDGGAARLAGELVRAFAGGQPRRTVAIGHSAGSIFHAHFLSRMKEAGIDIAQLHLLAPAITHELFDSHLAGRADATMMFTMTREAERGDNCASVYNKSLLYLVSNAFERDDERRILGMEDFWTGEPKCEAIFGPTPAKARRDSSTASRSHGGFDNDPLTMESVLRRIRDFDEGDHVDPPFPRGDIRTARPAFVAPNLYGIPKGLFETPEPLASIQQTTVPAMATAGGKRVALCIGNDAFPSSMALSGCINDAKAWQRTFQKAGFDARLLTNATGGNIREAVRSLAERCSPGDTFAIHFSSHGTQIPDATGDETGDPELGDVLDEATLGIDWEDGGMIIDDEWPGLLTARLGVHILRFSDFCHSGRSLRMMIREKTRRTRSWTVGDPVAQRAVAELGKRAERASSGYAQDAAYLNFCACQPHELAAEEGGMGLFSRAATEILGGQGESLTATELAREISKRLAGENQNPMIEGPDAMAALPVFGPLR